jgi:hypothetical protein
MVLRLVSWRGAGVSIALVTLAESWTSPLQRHHLKNRLICQRRNPLLATTSSTARFASLATTTTTTRLQLSTNNPEVEDNDAAVDRTTFDQAGASLIEEDDQKRMEQMGDFDLNPAVRGSHVSDRPLNKAPFMGSVVGLLTRF